MVEHLDFFKIHQIEKGLLANRPSLETVNDGSWVWRFANGFTGRANSLQALDRDDHLDFENRLHIHWQRSQHKGIAPRFRVTPTTPPKIVEFLIDQGFERQGNTLVLEFAGSVVSKTDVPDLRIIEHLVTDSKWQKQILALENIKGKDADTFTLMMERLPFTAVGLSLVQSDGAIIGAVYASCQNGMGSVFALEVNPAHRGKGFARLLMNYLDAWFTENGAERVVLQVVVDNKVAVRLYRSMGFEEIYKYYYLVGK